MRLTLKSKFHTKDPNTSRFQRPSWPTVTFWCLAGRHHEVLKTKLRRRRLLSYVSWYPRRIYSYESYSAVHSITAITENLPRIQTDLCVLNHSHVTIKNCKPNQWHGSSFINTEAALWLQKGGQTEHIGWTRHCEASPATSVVCNFCAELLSLSEIYWITIIDDILVDRFVKTNPVMLWLYEMLFILRRVDDKSVCLDQCSHSPQTQKRCK